MGYPVMMALAVACFAGLAAPVVGQDTNCVLSDLDEFEFMVSGEAWLGFTYSSSNVL